MFSINLVLNVLYETWNISSKHSQSFLDYAKQSALDSLKTTLKRSIQKIAEATGELIGNKIPDKITKVSRSSSQKKSETVESKTKNTRFYREISKQRNISQERR